MKTAQEMRIIYNESNIDKTRLNFINKIINEALDDLEFGAKNGYKGSVISVGDKISDKEEYYIRNILNDLGYDVQIYKTALKTGYNTDIQISF